MAKKNKNLIWIVAGVAVAYFLFKKKKADQQKTGTQTQPTIINAAARALSNELQNVNFVPANENDRFLYANDQKLCK